MTLMFLKNKLAILVLFFIIFSLFISFVPLAKAVSKGPTLQGIDDTLSVKGSDEKMLNQKLTNEEPEVMVGKIIGTLLAWSGVGFFVLIFSGGLIWMTAQGNEQKVEKAKQIIIAAIFGLLIILSAYAITAYIGGNLF